MYCRCPAQCSGAARALLIPLQCWRVLLSCHTVFLARCVVCVWWTCVCGVRVVGYPLSATPSQWWWWGRCGRWVAWRMVGGMVSEGRQCCWTPRRMLASPSACWCPPCRLPCGPVEWRCVVGCVVPAFGLGPPPSHCSCPSCIVLLPLVLFSPSSPFVFAVTALLV